MSGLSEERLGLLRLAKLRALLGDKLSGDERVSGPLGGGAALVEASGLAAVLVEDAGPRSLGGVLVWATRHRADKVIIVVDAEPVIAQHLARQASYFNLPVSVSRIVGTSLESVVAESLTVIASGAPDDALGVAIDPFVDMLTDAGCEVVVEHGVVKGEVLGLEVARVVVTDGVAGLEVGVGKFDREISAMMNANLAPEEALRKAIGMVRRYRHVAATTHPLRDLVPERWLRCLLIAEPGVVGAASLRPVDTTVEPQSLREAQPAAAWGPLEAGGNVVALCTAGVDLDIVPLAEDTRRSIDPDADLVICGPSRNQLEVIRSVSELLERPARFVGLELPY